MEQTPFVFGKLATNSDFKNRENEVSLLSREIIDINADHIDLQDPFFKYWLKREYFRL